MVERYNQPGLASPVVGTPGVNPAAGKAMEEVSKLATNSVNQQFQFAQKLGSEGEQIGQTVAIGAYFAGRSIAEQIDQKARMSQDLAFAGAKSDLDSTLQKTALGLQNKYSGSPDDPLAPALIAGEAPATFKGIVTQLTDSAKDKGKYYQKQVADYVSNQGVALQNHLLTNWKDAQIKNNLEGMTTTVPIKTSAQIAAIDQSLPVTTQQSQKDKILSDQLGIYDTAKKQALQFGLKGYANKVDLAKENLITQTNKNFISGGIAGTNLNASGISQIKDWTQQFETMRAAGKLTETESTAIENQITAKTKQVTDIASNDAMVIGDKLLDPLRQLDPEKEIPYAQAQIQTTKNSLEQLRSQELNRAGGPRKSVLDSYDSNIKETNSLLKSAYGVDRRMAAAQIAATNRAALAAEHGAAEARRQVAATEKLVRVTEGRRQENPEAISEYANVYEKTRAMATPLDTDKFIVGGKTRGLKQVAKDRIVDQLPATRAALDNLYKGGSGSITKAQYLSGLQNIEKAKTLLGKNVPPAMIDSTVEAGKRDGQYMRLLEHQAGQNPLYLDKMKNAYFDEYHVWTQRFPNMTHEQELNAARAAYNHARTVNGGAIGSTEAR